MIVLPQRVTLEQPEKLLALLRKLIGFEAEATIDVASLGDGVGATTSAIAVVGAQIGDYVLASFGVDLAGITVTGYVNAADQVKLRVQNESGGTLDLASTLVRIRVLPAN